MTRIRGGEGGGGGLGNAEKNLYKNNHPALWNLLARGEWRNG